MKLLLVMDVEEHGDYYADVYRKDADDRFEGRYYLKPLPQEREFSKRNILPIKVDGNSFVLGWNACLKEITK